jgi:hypothetical protein
MVLTIITPCSRPDNLSKVQVSIRFDLIDKWIIVYDTSKKTTYTKKFQDNPQIIEIECSRGIRGSPQRNEAINLVEDGFIYFLDDDNIIHPEFWQISKSFELPYFYTFNQWRKWPTDKKFTVLPGNEICIGKIDTAMYCIHKTHIGQIRWKEDKDGCADGLFIEQIYENNKDSHKYIDIIAAYYNQINHIDDIEAYNHISKN